MYHPYAAQTREDAELRAYLEALLDNGDEPVNEVAAVDVFDVLAGIDAEMWRFTAQVQSLAIEALADEVERLRAENAKLEQRRWENHAWAIAAERKVEALQEALDTAHEDGYIAGYSQANDDLELALAEEPVGIVAVRDILADPMGTSTEEQDIDFIAALLSVAAVREALLDIGNEDVYGIVEAITEVANADYLGRDDLQAALNAYDAIIRGVPVEEIEAENAAEDETVAKTLRLFDELDAAREEMAATDEWYSLAVQRLQERERTALAALGIIA